MAARKTKCFSEDSLLYEGEEIVSAMTVSNVSKLMPYFTSALSTISGQLAKAFVFAAMIRVLSP